MLPRRISAKLFRPEWLRMNRSTLCGSRRCYSQKTDEEEKNDEPVQYSRSKAARWTAQQTLGEPEPGDPSKEPPKIQGPVVSLSLLVFMAYFFIFREENDLDEMLRNDLYKPLPPFQQIK